MINLASIFGRLPPSGEIPDTVQIDLPEQLPISDWPVNLIVPPGFSDRLKEFVTSRPLLIYFVLDISYSMDEIIRSVKNSVRSLVSSLEQKNFAVKVSFVGFRDDVTAPSPLGSAASLAAVLDSISINELDGGDTNEAALLALDKTLDAAITEGNPQTTKAFLMVTDVPGHTGTNPRNCEIDQLVQKINSLAQETQKFIKLFYSVGSEPVSGTVKPCGGYVSARDQWNAILKGIFPNIPPEKKGGALRYPFDEMALEQDFVKMIENVTPAQDLACLVKRVDLMINGQTVRSNEVSDSAKLFKDLASGASFVWEDAFPENSRTDLEQNKSNQLIFHTCCVANIIEGGRSNSSCEAQKKVVVNFKVKTN